MVDMRTPLKVARGLGSAKSGTEHFWRQRVTGVASVFLGLFLVWLVASLVGADAVTVKARLAEPVNAIGILALVIVGAVHMRLGMQVIIEDYVHGNHAKLVCLILNSCFAGAIALAGAFAILKISLGA